MNTSWSVPREGPDIDAAARAARPILVGATKRAVDDERDAEKGKDCEDYRFHLVEGTRLRPGQLASAAPGELRASLRSTCRSTAASVLRRTRCVNECAKQRRRRAEVSGWPRRRCRRRVRRRVRRLPWRRRRR